MYIAREIGSPNGSIHRTFRAIFEMPVIQSNHNLIKVGKRRYRNPIYLAREWQRLLKSGERSSPAALSRYLQVSRARVTQIMNLLLLSPEVKDMISSLGDPLRMPAVSERRLRPLLALPPDQQKIQVKLMLSKATIRPSVKTNLTSTSQMRNMKTESNLRR